MKSKLLAICAATLLVSVGSSVGAPPLTLVKTIPLPNVSERIDHFAVDTKGHQLFVAALGNNTLEVIDLAGGKWLTNLVELHRPTDVLYLTDQNQIAVANSDEGKLMLYQGSSYGFTKAVDAVLDADNLRLAPDGKQIYLGYADGALAVIDTATFKQTASIKLPAHPESFQLEPDGNRIFVNVPDAKQIVVIDREQQKVVATWPMEKFQDNFAMALDASNHRLFVGCRSPARLLVLDNANGKMVADYPISRDIDDLFYDAARKRLYLSCGEGFIDVFDQKSADEYQLREKIPTRAGARTSFFSPDLNQFYLAVPRQGKKEAEIRVYQLPK
jgi:DNA-binding beta-propeller fold protein YncE